MAEEKMGKEKVKHSGTSLVKRDRSSSEYGLAGRIRKFLPVGLR